MRRNPNKADISRDVRVADRPEKRPEEIEFEEDLAYLKEISVPLEKRQAEKAKRKEWENQFHRKHDGWALIGLITLAAAAIVSVCILYHTYQSTLGQKADVQAQRRDQIYAACQRQNANANAQRDFVQAAIEGRMKDLRGTSGPRRLQLERIIEGYRRALDQIRVVDCNQTP